MKGNWDEMKVVSGDRQSGKTTQLVEEAAKGSFYIVCADKRRVDYVWTLAQRLELDIPFPMTFEEYISGNFGRGIKGFLIDDVDALLRVLSRGVPIAGFAYTNTPST